MNIPKWALKEDGSLGDTTVPKLGMEQEYFARLASERYEKILELERRNIELSGEVAFLRDRLKEPKVQAAVGSLSAMDRAE